MEFNNDLGQLLVNLEATQELWKTKGRPTVQCYNNDTLLS